MTDLNPNDLPSWARAVIEKGVVERKEPSIADHRSDLSWPLFVDAATVATFLPRDLVPAVLSGAERKNAEKTVLRFAELTQDAEGVRWSLTRDARREVLNASNPNEIAAAVNRTGDVDDPLTVALRRSLRGTPAPELDKLSDKDIEATRLAATWLTGLANATVPKIDDLDRQIELRRLLAPFERMIGKMPPGTDPKARPDRFFGRADEMEDLRAYVGVVAADTLGQNVLRVAQSVARVFVGRKPKTVWGTGGVGKTTLLAKFMLEHGSAAADRFPFAYLDFDRSTISARNRAGLLSEICGQIAAQFENLAQPLMTLRKKIADLTRTTAPGADPDAISYLMPYTMELCHHIDTAFDSSRPFLLVFDTFEIVQYGPDQVIALEEFVRSFTGAGDNVWQRLRLIISGRQKVPQFLGSVEELELGALDPKGSADMLAALAGDAGKPIDDADAKRLVDAIVKATGGKERNGGVRPLRLRLVAELFKGNEQDGPEIVQSLIDDLKKPSAEQDSNLVGRMLVDGILVRRILGRVSDARVRALADPGLVVRRITKDVIREVMTRGTQKPDGTDNTPPDLEKIDPWIVDDAEAASIFEAFGREVSLVEQDGAALRHRQDVRQEMLPLIEARRPRGFQRIHTLAFEHFRAKAQAAKDDYASAAEAVYHGLWLNKPIPDIDRLWPDAPSFDARIDSSEFGKDSLQNLYLRVKKRVRLTPDEIRLLPRTVAVDWLAARTDELLDQRRLVDEIEVIRAVGGDGYEGFDGRGDVASVVARLLYRAGSWREAAVLLRRNVNLSVEDPSAISSVRTWATITAKSSALTKSDLYRIVEFAGQIPDPIVRTEILAHAVLAARPNGLPTPVGDKMLQAAQQVSRTVWRREMRILRLAIAAAPSDFDTLLNIYVQSSDRLFRDASAAEILTRMRSKPTSLDELDSVWKVEKTALLQAAADRPDAATDLRALIAADHSDWFLPFGNAISRSFGEFGKQIDTAAKAIIPTKSRSPLLRATKNRDGHSLLQLIVAEGGLFAFAEALATASSKEQYPETAPEIASALVRWHRSTVPGSQGGGAEASQP